jgi:hypothetical protein
MKSAALTSAGVLTGLGGILQFSDAARAATTGSWSPLAGWPLIPIHAVLLGNGQVLTYGTNRSNPDPAATQTGRFFYDIWDPDAGLTDASHFTLPNATITDLFCNAQIVLPQSQSGEVLLAGGDNWDWEQSKTKNTGNNESVIFHPGGKNLTQGKPMQRSRWYATPTTLPDGRIYIQGGIDGEPGSLPGDDRPEIRDLGGDFHELSDVNTASYFPLYPRNFVIPDGRIFGYSNIDMYFVNPAGNGSLTPAGRMPADGPSGWSSSDVMFAPGRILRVGGGTTALPEQGGGRDPSKNAAAIIDIVGGTPTYKRASSMPVSLHWPTATLLADGQVVVTGGTRNDGQVEGANYQALIWKIDTGKWTRGAASRSGRARMYHSIALLLPDASVLVGGGGSPGPQANQNAEIYYPPYLFTSQGVRAARPSITEVPSSVNIGQTFTLKVDRAAAIQRVTLLKTGSVTHSFNFEQRFMELRFTRTASGLLVEAPASKALATPGYYMIFVIDGQGVPSVAKIIQIPIAP